MSQDLGNELNRALPLSDDIIEKLWEGMGTPEGLLNIIWFQNTQLLGFRGNHESRQLMCGDAQLLEIDHADDSKEQVLKWNQHLSKMRDGVKGGVREYIPTMCPDVENPERCPVTSYIKYRDNRPESMKAPRVTRCV